MEKSAKTTVYPLLVEGNKSKIKLVIESGRTHQIRVHLNFVGLPIIGDAIYGRTASNVNRVLLHSKLQKSLIILLRHVNQKSLKCMILAKIKFYKKKSLYFRLFVKKYKLKKYLNLILILNYIKVKIK